MNTSICAVFVFTSMKPLKFLAIRCVWSKQQCSKSYTCYSFIVALVNQQTPSLPVCPNLRLYITHCFGFSFWCHTLSALHSLLPSNKWIRELGAYKFSYAMVKHVLKTQSIIKSIPAREFQIALQMKRTEWSRHAG